MAEAYPTFTKPPCHDTYMHAPAGLSLVESAGHLTRAKRPATTPHQGARQDVAKSHHITRVLTLVPNSYDSSWLN